MYSRVTYILPPLLLVIYMGSCLIKISNDDTEETLVQSNDVTVITGIEENLYKAIKGWKIRLERKGMKSCTRKTEVLHIEGTREETELFSGKQQVKLVNNFACRGVNVN